MIINHEAFNQIGTAQKTKTTLNLRTPQESRPPSSHCRGPHYPTVVARGSDHPEDGARDRVLHACQKEQRATQAHASTLFSSKRSLQHGLTRLNPPFKAWFENAESSCSLSQSMT